MDQVRQVLKRTHGLSTSNAAGEKQILWKDVLVRMLRTTIYERTEEERLYLGKLSRIRFTALLALTPNEVPVDAMFQLFTLAVFAAEAAF
jgi:hypothetical protein